MGQGCDGGHSHFDISAQNLCAGLGQSGLLQGQRRRDRFHCLDGVVPDADANAACNIPARLYDAEITLYMPHGEVKALLVERTRLSVGTARPGLELQGPATAPPSTESELPQTHNF